MYQSIINLQKDNIKVKRVRAESGCFKFCKRLCVAESNKQKKEMCAKKASTEKLVRLISQLEVGDVADMESIAKKMLSKRAGGK